MADKIDKIPPKLFYKLSQSEQWSYAVGKMREHYEISEKWRKISIQCKKSVIVEKEIERPDEATLKS
jgi:hypothetical protein